MHKLIVVSTLLFVMFFHLNPARADNSVDVRLGLIADKLVAVQKAVDAGKGNYGPTLEVLKKKIEDLAGLPDMNKDTMEAIKALKAKIDALEAKLGLTSHMTALVAINGMSITLGTGALVSIDENGAVSSEGGDEGDDKVAVSLLPNCGKDYYPDVDLSYRQSGKLIKGRKHITCKPMPTGSKEAKPAPETDIKPDEKKPVPSAALAPTVDKGPSTGWMVAGGLVGGLVLGGAGWYAGNSAAPVTVTDNGVKGGMGPPVAIIGGILGAAIGAGVGYLATAE